VSDLRLYKYDPKSEFGASLINTGPELGEVSTKFCISTTINIDCFGIRPVLIIRLIIFA
jgi:hypothetical protein